MTALGTRVYGRGDVVARSWYPVAPASEIRRGRVHPFELAGRRLVAYRDASGKPVVLDARCPHLGADLKHGLVEGDGIRCALHGWRFGAGGACDDAPGHASPPARRLRAYPSTERWGLVWMFNGDAPGFDLPDDLAPPDARRVSVRPRDRPMHAHVLAANVLDVDHFGPLHGFDFQAPPALLREAPHRLRLELHGRLRSRWLRAATRSARDGVRAQFTVLGCNITWVKVLAPQRFDVVFGLRPLAGNRTRIHPVFLMPRRRGPLHFAQALLLVRALTWDDARVLEGMQPRGGFTEQDRGLRAFAEQVDALGAH